MASIGVARLPVRARARASPPPTPRHFSASAPQTSSLLDAVVSPLHCGLDLLHSTGLPWYAVIPLSALVARGLVVYHVSHVPQRRAAQTHALLIPVANTRIMLANTSGEAARLARQDEHALEHARFSPAARLRALLRGNWRRFHVRRRAMNELGRQFGAPYRHWRGLLGFGTLIAMTETIRVKAGAKEGLLSLLLHPLQSVWDGINTIMAKNMQPDVTREGNALPADTQEGWRSWIYGLNERKPDVSEASSSTETAQAATESTGTTTALDEATESASQLLDPASDFDPTMKVEGLPWCLDLTQPDPTFCLPLALAVYMMWNIFTAARAANRLGKEASSPSSQKPKKPVQQHDSADPRSKKPAQGRPPADVDPLLSHLTAEQKALLTDLQESVVPKRMDKMQERSLLPRLSTLQTAQLTLAYLFALAAIKMPAGILLYILSSQLVAGLQRRWLDIRMPIRKGLQPCKRPLRWKVQREW